MEKDRVSPSASVSEGAIIPKSRNCPAWNLQPAGFSSWIAMVRSATTWRLTNRDIVAVAMAAALISALSCRASRRIRQHDGSVQRGRTSRAPLYAAVVLADRSEEHT